MSDCTPMPLKETENSPTKSKPIGTLTKKWKDGGCIDALYNFKKVNYTIDYTVRCLLI